VSFHTNVPTSEWGCSAEMTNAYIPPILQILTVLFGTRSCNLMNAIFDASASTANATLFRDTDCVWERGREISSRHCRMLRILIGVQTLRSQESLDPRHFGTLRLVPKCPDIPHQCLSVRETVQL